MYTLKQLRSGKLSGARRLNLSCGLTDFPQEIFELADTLEILDLSGNALTSLPDHLPQLSKLRVLFCSDNQFTHLPEVLGECAQLTIVGFRSNQIRLLPPQSLPCQLRALILTGNQLTQLPGELAYCTQLQKLMLAGNRLHTLPDAMAACTQLELLRISANCFQAIPEWLLELPRLAWLAYGGNPFCSDWETAALTQKRFASIEWSSLALLHEIGAGASGTIYHAQNRQPPEIEVAVKLFKGDLTSDGFPRSEMACNIAAGTHPNLIPVHGKIEAHPQGTNGLVMDLLGGNYNKLAHPPSLDSCTRDVYGEEARFTAETVAGIALSIASAAEHLHERGLLHGDLYAHNILHASDGHALLCDFGAASFLDQHNEKLAHGLQRIEVRAFACLLEELMARCEDSDRLQGLLQLQARCAHSVVAIRPLFKEIRQRLQNL